MHFCEFQLLWDLKRDPVAAVGGSAPGRAFACPGWHLATVQTSERREALPDMIAVAPLEIVEQRPSKVAPDLDLVEPEREGGAGW